MKIAFDAVPLVSDRMTGIGWCEAGQTTAMARLHPENSYTYSFFSRKDDHIKLERLAPFTEGTGIGTQLVRFSGWIYGHDHSWCPDVMVASWRGQLICPTLALPSTGLWGDIGYVVDGGLYVGLRQEGAGE